MQIIFFDDISRESLLPLTFTRPVADLRVGILKIREKWEHYFHDNIGFLTKDYLSVKFNCDPENDNLLINGSILPDPGLFNAIKGLHSMQALCRENKLIAARLTRNALDDFNPLHFSLFNVLEYSGTIDCIEYPWQIFLKNGKEIENDYHLVTANRKSDSLHQSNNLICSQNIFAEEGVKADYVTLNASTGPVYLGKNSEIMEGSVIRGPFALGEGAVIKLSAKIYGPTTIGPFSKAGGEINNCILQAYSNKAHDGFLGNSVLGEWCNIGADSNNSNLKNNYAEVKLWSYRDEKFIPTGLQYCGLIMGDHSKCGINTMFNTGTVVGVSANIFGTGFPRNFIPSFSWGGPQGFSTYSLNKAFETAEIVMSRRNMKLDEKEKSILTAVFAMTEKFRR